MKNNTTRSVLVRGSGSSIDVDGTAPPDKPQATSLTSSKLSGINRIIKENKI